MSSQLSIFFLVDALVTEPDSLFALEVVRQRLHEKIQEARHQVTREASGLWGAVWFIRVVSLLCLEEKVPCCSLWGLFPARPAISGAGGRGLSCHCHPCSGSCEGLSSFDQQEIRCGLQHLTGASVPRFTHLV